MPRIRTIKPEFYRSPSTAKVSFPGRILYLAMWNWADDYGIGETNINGLLGFAFCDTDSVTAAEIPRLLTEVHSGYEVEFYEHHGRFYYQIVSWDSHQKTERRATRKNPTADDPDSVPDMRFHGSGGSSAQTLGKTPAGTGNRGTGEVGTGEGSSVTLGLGGPGGEPANLPVTAKAAPVSRGTRLPEAWMPKEDIIAHLLR
ncbi:hypothetical protein JF735_00005, partial [Mycobacterium avium]|uniref:hypothetical protein n=2 Tax=Mycobacterium avium TaxID=1764 RepID=UPI001CDAC812